MKRKKLNIRQREMIRVMGLKRKITEFIKMGSGLFRLSQPKGERLGWESNPAPVKIKNIRGVKVTPVENSEKLIP